jgi:hypothetical protein
MTARIGHGRDVAGAVVAIVRRQGERRRPAEIGAVGDHRRYSFRRGIVVERGHGADRIRDCHDAAAVVVGASDELPPPGDFFVQAPRERGRFRDRCKLKPVWCQKRPAAAKAAI